MATVAAAYSVAAVAAFLPVEVGYILREIIWCNGATSASSADGPVFPVSACGVAVQIAEGLTGAAI